MWKKRKEIIDNQLNYTAHDTAHDSIHDDTHDTRIVYKEIAELAHRLVSVIQNEMSRVQLMKIFELNNRSHFTKNYLNPALSDGLIVKSLPDKSKSKKQKYKLTPKGQELKQLLQNEHKPN